MNGLVFTNLNDKLIIEVNAPIGQNLFNDAGENIGFTLDKFKDQVLGFINDGQVAQIDVNIQSYGGNFMEAMAIHDYMRSVPVKVVTNIIGPTASAGTIIGQGGDYRTITQNSRYFIHRVQAVIEGDADDVEKLKVTLEDFDEQLINLYRKRTGKKKEEILNLMRAKKFISAQEALAWGFVDEIIKDKKFLNQNEKVMTEDIMKLLKVSNEIDALKAVNDLVEANEKLEANIGELQNKVKEYEVAEKQAQAESINNYLDEAVKAGKIKADAKDTFFALAETNFELVKNTIDGIVIPENKSIQEVIDETENKVDLPKFKDNLRKNIYKNNVEQYRKDFKQAYGYEATI